MEIYLQINNLNKSFGERILFENVSFSIEKGEKVAIIAPNGAGKSTLMKIISGSETSDSGDIILKNGISIGYLEQNPLLNPENSVLEEIFHRDTELMRVVRNYEAAVHNADTALIMELTAKMDNMNAWDYDTCIRQILSKLKIHDHNRKIKHLSGGELKRMALAKVLIEENDLLIMDEPTNHLDMEMNEWLEEYLSISTRTLLIVTHDRYFLDQVCNRILELEPREIFSYSGNYSYYIKKRAERMEIRNTAIAKARNLLRREQEWMDKMPQARGHKARYRIDNFYELRKKAETSPEENGISINIGSKRMGKKIIELHAVNKSYEGRTVISDFSYKFAKGEKIGIIGPNGIGKSTLLGLITQNILPDSGRVEIGETIEIGYYEQKGIRFDETERVIDYIKNIAEYVITTEGRQVSASQFLEYFLFDNKMQYTPIEKLSGGEKRRLYLMSILMKSPNFLILDEPTNDLDIATLRVLEDYLSGFDGCVLIVSHDRFFTDRVVERVFAFETGGMIKDFPGNYSIYRAHKKEEEISYNEKKGKIPSKSEHPEKIKKKSFFNEKKEKNTIENTINTLNEEKQDMESRLNSGELNTDELIRCSKRMSDLLAELENLETRWLELDELINFPQS